MDYFELVSKIDAFLNEFRNVTFVLQKAIGKDSIKKDIYLEKIKDYFEENEYMHWLKEARNKVVKESPIEVEKVVEVIVFDLKNEIKSQYRVDLADFSDNSGLFNYIETQINPHILENYISTRLKYIEKGKKLDIIRIINFGLKKMIEFLNDISISLKMHSCNNCNIVKKRCIEKINKFSINQIVFKRDYEFDKEKGFKHIGVTQAIVGPPEVGGFSQRVKVSDLKSLLGENSDASSFGDFVITHYSLFFFQQRRIMPTFYMFFSDDTMQLDSFEALSKATIFRKLSEVREKVLDEGLIRVLYVGEIFSSTIDYLRHEDRMKNATNEFLHFVEVDMDLNLNEILIPSMDQDYDLLSVMMQHSEKSDSNSRFTNNIINSFKIKYHPYLHVTEN